MRYRITTTLKKGILDNAGKATVKALQTLGFENVGEVRIGKTIELNCDSADIDSIAKSTYNEVMEDFTIQEMKEENNDH